jgi:sigma-B regulation protein RsbU (phosphoserine phosphatase)
MSADENRREPGATATREEQFKQEFIDLYAEIDLHSLLDKIAKKINHYLHCEESAIFLYSPHREELYFEIVTGAKEEELKRIVLKKGEGVVGWVAMHNRSVVINDTAKDSRFTSVTDVKTNFKTRSIAAVPVRMEDKLLGVLEAVNSVSKTFSEEDRQLLEYISHFIAIPLQNALLFKDATREKDEKGQLIELGKIISSSIDLDQVFRSLKSIISRIVEVVEIRVTVAFQNKVYGLVNDQTQPIEKPVIPKTSIHRNLAVFPLKTGNRQVGFMQIEAARNIPPELRSLMEGVAVFTAIAIERIEMVERMVEKEKIDRELKIARSIQQSFLFSGKCPSEQLDVAYVNIPSSQVGGDYYDIVLLNDDETIFSINDTCGHGVSASLLMSVFSASFKYRIKKDRDIVTTISHLNNLIAETTAPNQYVTSFTCLVNAPRQRLHYVNCGHCAPILVGSGGVRELAEGSFPLGMFRDVQYQLVETAWHAGDLIAFFTDGIIEAENPGGTEYSKQRLIDFLEGHRRRPAEEIKRKLIADLRKHIQKDVFEDDITFIMVKHVG